MYKTDLGNLVIYFLCYKKKDMKLIESYYDEILGINYLYINSFLSFKKWKNKSKKLSIDNFYNLLLTISSYCYIDYKIKNNEYKHKREKNKLFKYYNVIKNNLF